MKLSISEKAKKDIFISIFQLLKSCSSMITFMFQEDHLYIQGMDNAHVCLFDLKIMYTWFYFFEKAHNDASTICVSSSILHNVLSFTQDKHMIHIEYDGEPDTIDISLVVDQGIKGDFNKYFTIPLIDLDIDLLGIPEVEYDAEVSINAKKICEISSQLMVFGDVMNVKCSEEEFTLSSEGTNGTMRVNVPIDDLSEFSISEGEVIELSYSLNYFYKMCLTTKLSTEIELGICKEYPLRIKYDLGENSTLMFYIAPKIDD